jgi:hypothetical protein
MSSLVKITPASQENSPQPETLLRVRQTHSAFPPIAQRNASRRAARTDQTVTRTHGMRSTAVRHTATTVSSEFWPRGRRTENYIMIGNVTTALQVNATTGNGFTVTLPGPRLLTFQIYGNGSVSAGQIAIECCPQTTPIVPGSGSGDGLIWTTLATIPVPANKEVEYIVAGSVSGTFRARISTPVTGGTVTVLAVRPEDQQGSPRRLS